MSRTSASSSRCRIWMVAAECKGVAKVGGLADVVHDLAAELTELGHDVRIIMPAYENLVAEAPVARTIKVGFSARNFAADILAGEVSGVPVDLVRCPEFFGGDYGSIYVDSSARGRGPYEDDAARFAFFSAATAALLDVLPTRQRPDILHCHDWHTGTLLLLLRRTRRYRHLADIPALFTIHNLDYQGQRPFFGPGRSSLEGWFPTSDFGTDELVGSPFADPSAADCYNPMRTAVELADSVNTVSPNYAGEITRPDDRQRHFVGGRGLESYLARRAENGTLVGLLNGIDYRTVSPRNLDPAFDADLPDWQRSKAEHKEMLRRRLLELVAGEAVDVAGRLGHLDEPARFARRPLLVAVTRMAAQKVGLLLDDVGGDADALTALGHLPANFLVLGTGERSSQMLQRLRHEPSNILHVARFDASLADLIYAAGDLFLMPSLFEPCGISQMIAMAYGTLPIVTPVGGLKDTVKDDVTGFVSPEASSGRDLVGAYVETVKRAVATHQDAPVRFAEMQIQAMQQRFTWRETAKAYVNLYQTIKRGLCT